MAHEITSSDNVVLVRERAWHNLGIVIPEAITPVEALRVIGADWEVRRDPIYRKQPDGTYVEMPAWFANVRSDNGAELGLAGKDWHAWQNIQVAEFAEALAKDGDLVKIETAGTIRGGKKIWFLLKGTSFSVRRSEDVIHTYICVSNGHDGLTGLRADNTSIRAVCSNTLHLIIPDGKGGNHTKASGYSCSHRGDLKAKVEEARAALHLYEYAVQQNMTMYDALAGRHVGQVEVDRFLTEVYVKAVENFPLSPTTDEQAKKRDKALGFISQCVVNFEAGAARFGANAWILLNAFTETSQARRKSAESQASSKLFGIDAARGTKALELALSLAT